MQHPAILNSRGGYPDRFCGPVVLHCAFGLRAFMCDVSLELLYGKGKIRDKTKEALIVSMYIVNQL
jgi:hypothetical protein